MISAWQHEIGQDCHAGDNAEALQALTTATSIQPQHPKATLALGSVLQDSLDLDGALQQYRVAAAVHPNIPQVWCPTSCSSDRQP